MNNTAQIPAELRARDQWVVWRYKGNGKKPQKVPYIPGIGDPASTTNPATWRSYDAALAFYHSRSTYYDGIGYVFAANDPFVGGDIDHSLDEGRLPPTYAEISPSGTGIKFIARATGTYGRKTARGELYSHSRFFTITGNVLPGHEAITDCQEAGEAFAASLGNNVSQHVKTQSGTGNGSRAELARAIPESTWEAGRLLLRTQRQNLIGRARAAAGEETQLALLLRGDYAEFHHRWPFVGLYRADGTLDASQVRAVAANGIKPRNFTFPEYCAIMSALYAADALAKWGTKDAWRAELASLWHKAPAPRYGHRARPAPTPRVKRGRAGSHNVLVEDIYQQLLDHRTGAQAIVTARQIAGVIYCARETVARIIKELVTDGRISTRRLPRHGGLVITFLDVIYSETQEAGCPTPAPEIEPTPNAIEETKKTNSVSSQITRADHSLPTLPADTVWHPPLVLPTLADLAKNYLDLPAPDIGERIVRRKDCEIVDRQTGEVKVSHREGSIYYRRTAKHFALLVAAEYPYTEDEALDAYRAEQQHRKDEAHAEWQCYFARLRHMPDDELIAYIAGRCRTEVHERAREGVAFDQHLYQTRLKCARQQLEWRGLTMPTRKTRIEQQARDDAERAEQARKRATPPKQRLRACQPVRYEHPTSAVDSGAVARAKLFASIRAIEAH